MAHIVPPVATVATLRSKLAANQAKLNMLEKSLADCRKQIEEETRNSVRLCSKFENDFEVQGVLGKSDRVCVFVATHKLDKWDYAVKRIFIDERNKTQCLREVRGMFTLHHENIVRYGNSWVETPLEDVKKECENLIKNQPRMQLMSYEPKIAVLYIQMEMCNSSLFAWLAESNSQLSRNMVLVGRWFKQIISACAYIHERNLIHRDLKPSNILLDGIDAEEQNVKITDLGISLESSNPGDSETAQMSIGTKLYMSPEQLRNSNLISSKTDIFTLGLIFAELCVPMTTSERLKIFKNIRDGVHDDFIYDRSILNFVCSLTQRDPGRRPSCKEILDNSVLDDEQSPNTQTVTPATRPPIPTRTATPHHIRPLETMTPQARTVPRFQLLPKIVPPFYIPASYGNYAHDQSGEGARIHGYVQKFDSRYDISSVVVKKFTNPFSDRDNSKCVLRELNLLRTLKHENILKFLGCYALESGANSLESIYHITEYCGEPMRNFIEQGTYFMNEVKKWTNELLQAVQYLHSKNVIHRNLNPDNICIDASNKLTLIGFGLARVVDRDVSCLTANRGIHTYTPIELQLDWTEAYDEKVDIWSVSTLLCELITGQPLFDDEKSVIQQQIKLIGPIEQEVLYKIGSEFIRNDLARYQAKHLSKREDLIEVFESKMEGRRKITNSDLYSNAYPLRDFLEHTLQFNAECRMSAEQALSHQFLLTLWPWERKLPVDDVQAMKDLRGYIWEEITASSVS